MRRFQFVVFVLWTLLTAASARAGLFGRDKVTSWWTAKPPAVDGDDSSWEESTAFEEDGLSVFARNDGDALYLLLTAHTREARDELSGESHQDVALWFVAADGKTRRWGARIPFSHRAPLTNALRDPAGLDPEPEEVRYQGAEISTGTLPEDVVDRLAAAGRRPIWELKIPIKRLEINADGAVAVDFVVNAPPGGAKRVRAKPPESPAEGGAETPHGRKRGGDATSHPEEFVWDALSYALSVRLAPDPSLQPR